ncbi:hypothetical protein FA95DRAFT_1537733 [Auriscalpium vulgare]|uniref:Uncharacterized protein n=1 Tax=Auriscalpium vulgare TaxID=40419 RepID=A0ACB8S0U2_9AGAM|nr:hypothetical protein FA95DRAFT_1537733 [Auriscalpium vulgare]
MTPSSESLADVCRTYPAIDNHAHPLLAAAHRTAVPFEGLVSEADGAALADSVHTLACFAATRTLAQLYGLTKEVVWDDVKAKRDKINYDDLCALCFRDAHIQCILLDDGLGGVQEMSEGFRWHDRFTKSPTRRIVRVEVLAQDILRELFEADAALEEPVLALGDAIVHQFSQAFQGRMQAAARDEDVVAFKSVVCYRTGLSVNPRPPSRDVLWALLQVYSSWSADSATEIRIAEKALNDYIVCTTLAIAGDHNKPVQFHTGLGDSDITLALSSPAHLQSTIKAFPQTTFVLLHSSYPYTRDSGYLTAVYPNVFLDFGEIFPFVSPGGQRDVLRQVMELAPTNKIMWSTDGHWWPESYHLGSVQARQALFDVLSEYSRGSGLTEAQAIQIAKNALFHTANRVYGLSLSPAL